MKNGGSNGDKTRIQKINRARIIEAALQTFSRSGFHGATLDEVAEAAGMSKSNMLYYYRSKKELYEAVMEHILEGWLEPLERLHKDDDPEEALGSYIEEKLQLSIDHPEASRLFANEVLQGAGVVGDVLKGSLKKLVDEKAAVLRAWMRAGKMRTLDPYHVIFMVWATTQHYSDFDVQIKAITGKGLANNSFAREAKRTLKTVLLNGLLVR
ncbi:MULTISPECIES: TetR family transcriptional regulator C-terminal domain-containing protein [Pseudovibrio]|uniref:TetR family transcriptional regulator C-terminal domain-containing protein n=1 Tax=Stappiaceae TaxID=2821832 RepID=UPI002365216A|nr:MULTISPECIES: TetR family transcriptional regulator C-terminal domain-containing protein [Pseudovibrio]MDD7908724.1 TetR family transcriptional regulator C-terminal domain-containing protein [Pseudovibrio exalbescens]MDX5592797.1 TetR family transcriptional regulator C-terminal domain-containing protein [Pseudovibrio sp. SPO723]